MPWCKELRDCLSIAVSFVCTHRILEIVEERGDLLSVTSYKAVNCLQNNRSGILSGCRRRDTERSGHEKHNDRKSANQ